MEDVLEQQFHDVLETPELEAPPVEPDAHRARIETISRRDFETGSSAFDILLTSLDGGFEMNYLIFPPMDWVNDVTIDPSTLSDEIPEGKKQSPRTRYASVVANKDKTAELQHLREIAYKAERTLGPGAVRPSTFDEYVELLNALLSGVEVVVTRRPDTSAEDAAFRNRLKVAKIHPISVMESPKALKKYKKAWEQQ